MKEQRFKSFFLSLLSSFVGILLSLQAFAQTKEAYGVLSEDGKTFTFRYDEYKTDSVRLFEKGVPQRVQKVIFEASFKDYRPTSTFYLFGECKALKEIDGIAYLNTEQVTDMRFMFSGCRSLTSLDLSNFNTKQVTDMSCMFEECSSLRSLNLSQFNTEQVTNMRGMFGGCSSLTTLNLSKFNTEQVTDMSGMFASCSSLKSLNLSNFNTRQVTNMYNMFSHCSSLKSLNLSNFNTEQVRDMCSMFNECSSLTSLDLSNFNAGQSTGTLGMFWGCSNLQTIFCRNSWENTNNLFYINPKLKGAAAYIPEKGGGDMANPHTGYFTLPGK